MEILTVLWLKMLTGATEISRDFIYSNKKTAIIVTIAMFTSPLVS